MIGYVGCWREMKEVEDEEKENKEKNDVEEEEEEMIGNISGPSWVVECNSNIIENIL